MRYPDFSFAVPAGVFQVKRLRNAKAWYMQVDLMIDESKPKIKLIKEALQTMSIQDEDVYVGPDFNIVIIDPPQVTKRHRGGVQMFPFGFVTTKL